MKQAPMRARRVSVLPAPCAASRRHVLRSGMSSTGVARGLPPGGSVAPHEPAPRSHGYGLGASSGVAAPASRLSAQPQATRRTLGAGPPSKGETLLLAAWDAERREDLWGEQEHWKRVAGQLEESLTWDPDDRDTYLRLIGYYWIGRHPLPVGTGTRTLAQGHVGTGSGPRHRHRVRCVQKGRWHCPREQHQQRRSKQVPKGRPDLARKELAQAGEWARSAHARAEIDLVAGLIALIENAETGPPALRDLVERLGGGLASHLALALAGQALSFLLPKLFKQVGLRKPMPGGRDDLLAVLARLRTYLDGGGEITGLNGSARTPCCLWAHPLSDKGPHRTPRGTNYPRVRPKRPAKPCAVMGSTKPAWTRPAPP